MLRLAARYVLQQSSQLGRVSCQSPKIWFSTMHQTEGQSQVTSNDFGKENSNDHSLFLGQKITRKEKTRFLINALFDLEDSKDAIYGTLDAWVAWEQNFPIAALKNVLLALEKEQQWHRVIQVIKWMLSKGQGTTVGTYQQLIRALDMDHRAEEAHNIWMKKIGNNLHSVPWQTCHLMISVYHRNNMLEHLVKETDQARRKFEFLEGTITGPQPPYTQSDWNTVNAMLVSWITNTIHPEVKSTLSKFRDAKLLWEHLK
ncbi:pentatricopeptide repeat-containing protein At4g18975, chloroplastic isoform X4 [Spinacia oleracea]|uniref:Pentatricopeptide repeat-containing protein At4g18975, chloroplastic isoform X4 n=1 Tax=Spinacia oleracea TaxID=3562 RepID=A0ABM3RBC6_SPIOL|nr:pentatricopeptide repeat-containing protein At4g18975, chloroplastic isoform X4 [Spinacia oleracea]